MFRRLLVIYFLAIKKNVIGLSVLKEVYIWCVYDVTNQRTILLTGWKKPCRSKAKKNYSGRLFNCGMAASNCEMIDS